MNFPILHIPVVGDGMVIALDAVLHVCISHGLAIGLMTMIVIFQTLAWRGKGQFWASAARSLLGPLVVVTTSVGAVTGVGIWFLTGSLAPEGIGALIHLFFWPWFIEWFAFTAEVILLLCYYYLWNRLITEKPGVLAAIGWGYVAASVFSGILISGILGFMLTPQGWPWGRTFAEAYFNPTFVPQCFLRLGGGMRLPIKKALSEYRAGLNDQQGPFLEGALLLAQTSFVFCHLPHLRSAALAFLRKRIASSSSRARCLSNGTQPQPMRSGGNSPFFRASR